LGVFVDPQSAVEMRVLFDNAPPQSRFYASKQLRRMAADALNYSKSAKGVYFTLNPLPLTQKSPANDNHITRRRWLLIDLDPKREPTVSSTESEKKLAHTKTLQVKQYLTEQDWPEPIFADSGNGWHLLYRLDLPNDDDSKFMVNGFLKGLANRFTDAYVEVDTKVGNASRICKLYGTVSRKGAATKDRPHRVSQITQIPKQMISVSQNQLKNESIISVAGIESQLKLRPNWSVEYVVESIRLSAPRKYVRKCDPAISGCNGHTTTFNTVLKLLGKFPSLTDEDAFNVLSRDWNPRCEPPWNDIELRRKISETRKIKPHPTERVEIGNESRVKGKPNKSKENVRVSRTIPSQSLPPDAFRQFPVDALPELLCQYVTSVGESIGCDSAFVAVPLLSVLAAAIGNSQQIELKKGWTEPAIVWSVIIGESGTQKTPAFKYVVRPIRELQERKLRDFQKEVDEYKKDFANYQTELEKWKNNGSKSGDPPNEPVKPKAVRLIVSDATMEALAPILADNPRGVLYLRDELAGWVGSHDKYSKGKTDLCSWLSIFSSDLILVDRKTGDRQTISIPHPIVSVTGGTQPGTLQRVFGIEHSESGFLARLLVTWPDRLEKKWSDKEVSAELINAYSDLIHGLFELKPTLDEDEQPIPNVLPLTFVAKKEWIAFVNKHGREQVHLVGDEAAAWSKLEAYAARFALIIHCVRIVLDDPTLKSKRAVDRLSIRSGIILARWFGHEVLRVYTMLRETDADRELRQFAEKLKLRGEKITAAELSEIDRRFPTSSDAEVMLQKLVTHEYGKWENVPTTSKGGRPTWAFRPNR